jgi:hypothetical protein
MTLLASAPSGPALLGRRVSAGSGSLGGGLVLPGHARGDAPAIADRDAPVFAQARVSALRSRLDAVRPRRRRCPQQIAVRTGPAAGALLA